ncbi:RNA exonuclease 4 [Mugil cephalus]|uniref:RNA exonuclease 4 n=1 Tax=Mugil cephalus TaxID=48193 RepID=UPI001FB84066|nr:RNA exonuclease 4 [Mugil cephalus]
MSKAAAKKPQPPFKGKINKIKKKSRIKKKQKTLLKEKVAKAQQTAPPDDAQQFSANWKILQEILKASEPEKKKPVIAKHQNGVLEKKATEKSAKKDSKDNAGPSHTDTEKKVKQHTVPNSVVPKETLKKVPAPPESRQSAAPKRKENSAKAKSAQAAKKHKSVAEETKPTEEDLWFDDVDPDDIEAAMGAEAAEIMRKKQGIRKTSNTESNLVKEKAFEGITRVVAIDCEMVGVGPGGEDSILARVSLVNQFGKCIYDKYVKPTEKVTDHRTAVSGIRPEDIKDGEDIKTVQMEVAKILQGRIVVGHAIHNDLKILLLDHPKKKIRDTQKYKPFRKAVKSGRPSLKALCRQILNVNVQQGEHSSVQDAQATMRLYTLVKKQWEAEIKDHQKNKDSEKKSQRKPKIPKYKDKN